MTELEALKFVRALACQVVPGVNPLWMPPENKEQAYEALSLVLELITRVESAEQDRKLRTRLAEDVLKDMGSTPLCYVRVRDVRDELTEVHGIGDSTFSDEAIVAAVADVISNYEGDSLNQAVEDIVGETVNYLIVGAPS
jgi:hypothetical protein